MLTVTRQGGTLQEIARQLQGLPERVIPYAAATALTRTAKAAQAKVQRAIPQVFDRPTPYTVKAAHIEPATAEKLIARVAIKNTAGAGSAPQEAYLGPQVFSGRRRRMASEKQLQAAGILGSGQSAVPGRDAPTDSYGNLPRSIYTSLRRALGAQKLGAQRAVRAGKYFVLGRAGNAGRNKGIAQRTGRNALTVLLAFVNRPPSYRKRLDFERLAGDEAAARFEDEFHRAAQALARKVQR